MVEKRVAQLCGTCLYSEALLVLIVVVLLRGVGLLGEWRTPRCAPAAVDLHWAADCCLVRAAEVPSAGLYPYPLPFVSVRWHQYVGR
jgi:hypothetical protein